MDAPPTQLDEPCEFDSCAAGSPPYGFNVSDPRLNYVNSYPVTSIKYGIDELAPKFFQGNKPDLAVAGPNAGNNLCIETQLSGTAGAATYAAKNALIPAIAFSGAARSQNAWNVTPPQSSIIYGQLATRLTEKLVSSGTPYLPDNSWLNVNFPIGTGNCTTADEFSFIFTRIDIAIPFITPLDAEVCGTNRLPTEAEVIILDGCYVTVSVGNADTKSDADSDAQGQVYNKLNGFFTCLP